jgi:hypothetical protein
MKRGINIYEALFLGLLLLKLHSMHYGLTWWEVFLPLVLSLLVIVYDFFNQVYNLTARLQKFVLNKFIRFKMKRAYRKSGKMLRKEFSAAKSNPGSWVNPENLGK